MPRDNRTGTLRIKKRLVAIISVLIVLTLMTTISYSTFIPVFAEGEQETEDSHPRTEKELAEQGQSGAQDDSQKEDKPEDAGTDNKTDNKSDAEAVPSESADKKGSGTEAEGDKKDSESGESEGEKDTEEEKSEEEEVPAADNRKPPSMPEVSATSFIVFSGSTSEKIIEEHAVRKLSPGKIAMLVTAMVVIDNMYNEDELENTVEITKKIAKYGDSFRTGERITVGNMLDAMLVGGSEEAAEGLARYSASKRSVFVRMMNSKAMELGIMDTQFVNPTGEYSTKQYSTAADCAVIMQAALRYPLIREALEKPLVEFDAVSKDSERAVGFRCTNPLISSAEQAKLYRFDTGGIMGETGAPVNAAQYAGSAVIDDMQFIVILMDSKADRVAYEAEELFEYANTIATKNTIVKSGKKAGLAKVRGGERTMVPAYTASKGFAYVPPEGSDELITTEIVMYNNLKAPMEAGDKVGEYRIYVADELKGTVDLIIKEDIAKGWYPSRIYISNNATIAIGVILALIFLLWLRILYVRHKRKRIRALRREQKLRQLARQQMAMDEDRRLRDWNYSSEYYEQIAPRTTDLRREAIEAAIKSEQPEPVVRKSRKARKKQARAERKKAKSANKKRR